MCARKNASNSRENSSNKGYLIFNKDYLFLNKYPFLREKGYAHNKVSLPRK